MTLIEVMIALLIFTVGVLAAAAMQGTGIAGIATAQQGIYNSVAAGNLLEHMMSLPCDDASLADTDSGFFPERPDHGPHLLADGRSTIEWEVADDNPVPGAKRIRVTVRRPTKGGTTAIFSYDYLRSTDFQ
jgi:hypothetical protein